MKKEIEVINKKVQLFLLHFAGGSAYSFNFLEPTFSQTIDFIPVELPGRGKRFNEKLLTNKKDAIQDYVYQIKKLRNKTLPYIVYGHSMGATLGLSVIKEMQNLNDTPIQLIVSGNPGPRVEEERKEGDRYLLNDIDFKNELRKLGGVPEEVLVNEELYQFFNPIMRADFETLEKDEFYEKGFVIDVPISAIMGSEEQTRNKIENWKKFTSKTFTSQILKGNHFFIYDHPDFLSSTIKCILNSKYSNIIL